MADRVEVLLANFDTGIVRGAWTRSGNETWKPMNSLSIESYDSQVDCVGRASEQASDELTVLLGNTTVP